MFVSGTSISYDFFKKSRFLKLNSHRLAIIFCAVFVIGVAGIFGTDFEAAWLFREGSFSTALVVPVFAAIITKRTFSEATFLATTISALTTFGVFTLLKEKNLIAFEPFYAAHFVAFITFLLTSYLDAHRKTEITDLTHS
jgi:hypothetical protein